MLLSKDINLISKKIEYDVMDIYMIHPGIVVSEYKSEFELDIEFAKEINHQIGLLTNGKPMPQLFIACPGLSVSRAVREWGATEEANRYTLSSAVVCDLLSHRIIGNFLIRVQKPPRPTKMFSNQEEAIEWLIGTLA